MVYPLAMSFNEPKEEKHRDLLLQIFIILLLLFFSTNIFSTALGQYVNLLLPLICLCGETMAMAIHTFTF